MRRTNASTIGGFAVRNRWAVAWFTVRKTKKAGFASLTGSTNYVRFTLTLSSKFVTLKTKRAIVVTSTW